MITWGDVSEGLGELLLNEDIDKAVFYRAIDLVDFFRGTGLSAPQIFSHGGDSVVFKWSLLRTVYIYLTVSCEGCSAMVSDKGRIKLRVSS